MNKQILLGDKQPSTADAKLLLALGGDCKLYQLGAGQGYWLTQVYQGYDVLIAEDHSSVEYIRIFLDEDALSDLATKVSRLRRYFILRVIDNLTPKVLHDLLVAEQFAKDGLTEIR